MFWNVYIQNFDSNYIFTQTSWELILGVKLVLLRILFKTFHIIYSTYLPSGQDHVVILPFYA